MAVLFAGGEFEAFEMYGDHESANFVFDTTTSAAFDSDYSRGCMAIRKPLSLRANFAATAEGWVHFKLYHDEFQNFAADNFFLRLIDSGSDQHPFVMNAASGTYQCRQNTSGTSYANFGSALTSGASGGGDDFESDTLIDIDLYWKIDGTNGIFEFFINQVSVARFDGDTDTGSTTVDGIALSAGMANSETIFARFSEVIVTNGDEDNGTLNWRLATLGPTADSATNNAWTNGETEVDDIGLPTDLTLMHSGTNGQIQGFVTEDISAGASADGLDIKAVVVSARGNVGESTVQNAQGHVRIGSTDYFSASIGDKSTAHLRYVQHVFDQDPDATADWTESVVNAAEFGLRAVT